MSCLICVYGKIKKKKKSRKENHKSTRQTISVNSKAPIISVHSSIRKKLKKTFSYTFTQSYLNLILKSMRIAEKNDIFYKSALFFFPSKQKLLRHFSF